MRCRRDIKDHWQTDVDDSDLKKMPWHMQKQYASFWTQASGT
jgi:hypothetical protein